MVTTPPGSSPRSRIRSKRQGSCSWIPSETRPSCVGPEDYFVPGLRETSAALHRGLPLRTHLAQIFGNANDLGHGRQLPCHSGSRASRHIVMSSCVSSQVPHATGIAWAARISKDPIVALCYLGDGGTSEED